MHSHSIEQREIQRVVGCRIDHHRNEFPFQQRQPPRYRRLRARGKTANVVNVAIAREMVGFIWSIACTVQAAPKTA